MVVVVMPMLSLELYQPLPLSARFSNDGRELKVKGNGDVRIKLEYDDNPNYAGEAVRSITINGVKWRKERKHKGSDTETLKINRNTAASTAFTKSGSDENNIRSWC